MTENDPGSKTAARKAAAARKSAAEAMNDMAQAAPKSTPVSNLYTEEKVEQETLDFKALKRQDRLDRRTAKTARKDSERMRKQHKKDEAEAARMTKRQEQLALAQAYAARYSGAEKDLREAKVELKRMKHEVDAANGQVHKTTIGTATDNVRHLVEKLRDQEPTTDPEETDRELKESENTLALAEYRLREQREVIADAKHEVRVSKILKPRYVRKHGLKEAEYKANIRVTRYERYLEWRRRNAKMVGQVVGGTIGTVAVGVAALVASVALVISGTVIATVAMIGSGISERFTDPETA